MRRSLRVQRDYLRSDWKRNRHWDSRLTLFVWRFGQALHGQPGVAAFFLRRLYHFMDALWVQGVIGAALPPQVNVGPGMRLPHAGRGVIIHHTVAIGAGVTMYHQVTIGVKDDKGAGSLGDDVYVGAGAKILGPVIIRAGAKVGANAVVVRDVPPNATAVGVPARLC